MMRFGSRSVRAPLLLVLGVAAAATATAGCGSGKGTSASTEPQPPATSSSHPAAPRYSLESTRRCLVKRGLAVSRVGATDPQLRALRDLAQRTSLQVRLDGETVGIAFGNGRLLAELLRAPGQVHVLELRGDALLMYRPAARVRAQVVRDCLRV